MKKIYILLICIFSVTSNNLLSHPFEYDLNYFKQQGSNSRVMVCFHGYGQNYRTIVDQINNSGITSTLISFNFPDHDIQETDDHTLATFGTIQELLSALYVINKTITDENLKSIDLYGFSAGGGALINLLAVLNSNRYKNEMAQIGIGNDERQKILSAITKGTIILDTPLKSMEEIIYLRGSTLELEIVAKKYRENNLRPIDNLKLLKGLELQIFLFFQNPDEIIFNRDDTLYIENLRQANRSGTTTTIINNDGGHLRPHASLWKKYLEEIGQ